MQHHQIPIDAIERAIDSAELDPGEITLDRAHPTIGTLDTCAAICCTEIGTPFKMIEALNSDEETRPYASQLLDRLRVTNQGDSGYCYYFPGVAFTGPVGRYDEKEG